MSDRKLQPTDDPFRGREIQTKGDAVGGGEKSQVGHQSK